MLSNLKQSIFHKLARTYLRSSESKMLKKSQAGALKAFHNAASNTPFYQAILTKNAVNTQHITNISKFKKFVPVINKNKTFIKYKSRIASLCTGGRIDNVGAILSSSGTSGDFSYGLLTKTELSSGPVAVDFGLDINFGILNKKTLLINCLPMGVKVPSNHAVIADISVRKDMATSLIRGFGNDFDLIIMVGENSFIKEVLEFGIEQGIDWKQYDVRIVIGEEGFPENFRAYLEYLLGYDNLNEKVIIGSSMGISELGLTVFQENKYTIRIRQYIDKHPEFRAKLFGEYCKTCPMLFVYYPMMIYLEEDEDSALPNVPGKNMVFTKLDRKTQIPLIRYDSGDSGKIIPYSTMSGFLEEENRADLIPEFQLPFAAIFERGDRIIVNDTFISTEAVKEGIYSNFNLPPNFTGNFKIRKSDDGRKALLDIQLKEKIEPVSWLKNDLLSAVKQYASNDIRVTLHKFEDFPWPLDYERKFKYID